MRCGYAALVGAPNVGKSTLMNALLGQRLSIASSRPQTTRQRILGICSEPSSQIIFLDTPGFLDPAYALQRRMVSHIESAMADADVLIVLIDAMDDRRTVENIRPLLATRSLHRPVLLVLNKADLIEGPRADTLVQNLRAEGGWKDVIAVSALRKKNIGPLLQAVIACLPEQPALYPPDIISEQPEKFFVAEFIREQVFLKYRDEVPYAVAVEIREFKERDDGKTYIAADIVVERDSQKGILIGKGGAALKSVGTGSRLVIEKFLSRQVFLDLHVKVRARWRRDENMLNRLGYTKADT